MRLLALALVLPACTVGDTLVHPGIDGLADEPVEDLERFARGASFPNEGRGGTALDVEVPGMWVSMGSMICAVDGSDGTIGVDVFPDEDTDEIVMIDADDQGFLVTHGRFVRDMTIHGDLGPRVLPQGDVVAGERLESGAMALVVDTDAGCALELSTSPDLVGLTDGPCLAQADIDELDGSLIVATGEGVLKVTEGQATLVSEATRAAVDPVTGALWTGSPGDEALVAQIGNSTVTAQLGGPVVDFDARNGVVVAFTLAPELIRLDAATGRVLDRQAYVGSLNQTRVMLGDNATSLVMEGPADFTFHRIRTDSQMGL